MSRPHLTRRLTLEGRTQTPDSAGGWTTTWAALGTHWAHVDARTGGEMRGPGGARSRLRLKITVRAAPEGSPARPRPGQRFREGGRLYHIQAVALSDAGPHYLLAHCEEETVQ